MSKPRSHATNEKALLISEDDYSSEDDPDLDAMLNTNVFGQSQSQQSQSQQSQSSPASSSASPKQIIRVAPPAPPPLSPTTIERKARHLVSSLPLSAVDSCTSLQDLAWRVTKRSVLLCRRNCTGDEAMGLALSESRGDKHQLISYLGHKHKRAGIYELTHVKHLRPISIDNVNIDNVAGLNLNLNVNVTTTATTTTDYLTTFLKNECNTKDFQNNPIAKKVEELVLLAMIQKVREKESQQQQQLQATQNTNGDENHDYDDAPIPKETDEKVPAPAVAVATSTANHDPLSDDNNNSSSSDDDDGMEHDVLDSPTRKRSHKEPLRDGDVICYDPPVGVAGRKDNLIHAQILGVHAPHRNTPFPLILNNGEHLPRDHSVKRVRKRHRGQLIKNEKATFKAISRYKLVTCGTTNGMAGIQRKAAKIAQIMNSNMDHVKDFARTFHVPKSCAAATDATTATDAAAQDNNDDGDGEPTMATTGKKRRAQESIASNIQSNKRHKTRNTDDDDDDDNAKSNADPQEIPVAIGYLKHLLQKAEQEAQKKRRRSVSTHAITLEQTKLALKVWSLLLQQQQQQHGNDDMNHEDLLDGICETYDLNFESAKLFLEGDKNKLVRATTKMEIQEALTKWAQEQPQEQQGDETTTIPLASTPELENDDKEQHEPPNTAGRKRRVEESTTAAAISQSSECQEAREEPAAQTSRLTSKLDNDNDGQDRNDEPSSKQDEAEEPITTGKGRAKESTVTTSQSHKRRKTCSQENNNNDDDDKAPPKNETAVEDHPAIGYLKQLLQKAQQEAQKKRRNSMSPHAITLEQIQLALEVWSLLQQQEKRVGKEIDAILDDLCTTHELDLDSAKSFLKGDKNNLVRATTKMEIQETLTQWVRQEQRGGEADA